MATYVWRNNHLVDRDTGAPMNSPGWEKRAPTLPAIVRDIDPYESPASGKMITSRSEQREDLAATGSRLVEPSESPTGGKLRNVRFAKKHGLEHMLADDARDFDATYDRQAKEQAEGLID